MITEVQELQFIPIGEHSNGLGVSSAQTISPNATNNPYLASKVLIQALTQNVRYTLNGAIPTASLGFQLKAGDPPVIITVKGLTLKVIEETATASLQFIMGN